MDNDTHTDTAPARPSASAPGLRSVAPPATRPAELNLRIFASLGRYIDATFGKEALFAIAARVGVAPEDLLGKAIWASHDQVEELLAAVRELVPDDETFKTACTYQMTAGYGPVLFALRALSLRAVYEQGCRTIGLVSRISRYELVRSEPNHLVVRYTSQAQESRSMCLSRIAQLGVMPTLWDLPQALITEHTCLAQGDPACEYEVTWLEPRRFYPAMLGALVGSLPLAVLPLLGLPLDPFLVAAPLIGACAGHILELQRANKVNLDIGGKTAEALRDIARQEAEARLELLALSQRQIEWSRMMEVEVAERTLAMDRIVNRLAEVEKARQKTLRGFSHDLRNPLTAIALQNSFLQENAPQFDQELVEVLEEQEQALDRMRSMLGELMSLTEGERWLGRVLPVEVQIEPLHEELRRRARALVHGRPIRTSVLTTREAPESILIDRMLLDRVIDNLLTNAAKYTARGSVVVELDGTPGFLTIKVSDTGRGITDQDIQRVFRPGGSDATTRASGSYGVGLSVVVQILAQIGGKLEVMSLPGTGTTFWAHFPVVMENTRVSLLPSDPADAGGQEQMFSKVVTIRRAMKQ